MTGLCSGNNLGGIPGIVQTGARPWSEARAQRLRLEKKATVGIGFEYDLRNISGMGQRAKGQVAI